MSRILDVVDDAAISLAECSEALAQSGFAPEDEDSLAHAALMLRRLGNNQSFLGDLMIDELARRHKVEPDGNSYGSQVIMLARPEGGQCFLLCAPISGPRRRNR